MGQQESGESTPPSKLEINLDTRGNAEVTAKIFDRHLQSPLASVMRQVAGCDFENPKDREIEGDWMFKGSCSGAFLRRGLLVGGRLQFAPLIEVLRQARVPRLDVVVRHPHTGFSRFLDDGWSVEDTAESVQYSKSFTPSSSPAEIPIAFGYHYGNFLPLLLLLLPVCLIVLMRWAALRAHDTSPVVIWFSYWRLFGMIMTGTWLLWVQGSNVLDGAALARFLLNGSSRWVPLQVTFYLVPPVLVQLICTVLSGAVLARVAGESAPSQVSWRHAFWHEPATIWPLLCLLAGVASIALFDALLLGILCLAIAYAAHVLLSWIWLRVQKLNGSVLPDGDLRHRVFELGLKAGVQVKQIYTLPAADGRLAAPFMFVSRRLFLSDALMKALRQREVCAVLAREFVHARRRHRQILAAAAVLALPLIYRFSHLPAIEGRLPWAIRGPLLVWITPFFLYWLWRGFERTAETEAAEIVGDEEALLTAMPKLAQFNILGLGWRKLERRFFPNGKQAQWRLGAEILRVSEEPPLA